MAGGGHMMFGSGIPRRAHRMNKRSYAVILNGDDVEKDVADFVLYPQSVVFPESPKLGVMLKEEGGELLVTGFSPGSVAENAGLKTEDVVLSVDNEKISSVEDLKLILFYKKKGDELTVKVRRKRFLFGDREIEIRAAL
jgi:S1-C subfamily serine protease